MKTQLINAQLAQVNAFFALVPCDLDRSARLKETNSEEEFYKTAAQLAQDLGFSFSANDVEEYFHQKLEFEATSSYSEDDLAAVAGGLVMKGCPGVITTICTFISGCWGSIC
jgi:predicted ribosomally synthesized peptide with nif11-like leader